MCASVFPHTYIQVYVYVYMHIHADIYTCICLHAYMYVHMLVPTHARTASYMHDIHAYMIHVYLYTYIT